MQAAGATLIKHYRDLAFMGFVEVLGHLNTILKNIKFCKEDILLFKPDVLVLIDYPGFNLRIAQWARQQGIKVVYYISPQVWAWKENRVKKIKRDVDKMLVILPFEVDFYRKHNFSVTYVGHPLVQVVQEELQKPVEEALSEQPIIALLPGSRKQEIKAKLPIMLQMVALFPQYRFIIAQAPSVPDSLYKEIIGDQPVQLIKNQTYTLLRQAKAAMVTSGTATLETALFGVPEVVCYKGNPLSYWLARKLIKVKYISLVNLIMNRPLVTELVQADLNSEKLKECLSRLLDDENYKNGLKKDYKNLWHLLGDLPASANAAREIIKLMTK
jgi:lipid-A-disaccharide synthase